MHVGRSSRQKVVKNLCIVFPPVTRLRIPLKLRESSNRIATDSDRQSGRSRIGVAILVDAIPRDAEPMRRHRIMQFFRSDGVPAFDRSSWA